MVNGQDRGNLDFARMFVAALPHSVALGMQVVEVGGGRAVIEMPYDERFVGDPDEGIIHGGAVSALMDTCGGVSVFSRDNGVLGTATLDLRIDYMRAATPGQTIRAEAECYHITRSIAFVRAVALDDDRDRPVAAATGAFAVERQS